LTLQLPSSVRSVLQIDESKWNVCDPDNILSYEFERFDTRELKFGADIHPREDMLQLTHKKSNCIIDFGYYGCEVKLDGLYLVYVVDGNHQEGLCEPYDHLESKDFLGGIKNVGAMLYKYT